MPENFKVITPAPRDVWTKLLKNDSRSMIFVTPQWMDCINEVEGTGDASRYYEFSNGKQAVLPLVRCNNSYAPFSRVSSMPHGWGMGGLIAPLKLDEREMWMILSNLKDLAHQSVSIRPNPLDDGLWEKPGNVFSLCVQRSSHILDISKGFEHYWWYILESSTRNKIRRAAKSGIRIECDCSDQAINDFYRIYLKWTDFRAVDRHIPVVLSRYLAKRREPFRKFRVVSRQFPGNCQVWTARMETVPIASSILLIHNVHAIYWRGYSDRALAGSTRATELLQKYMIEEACRRGCLFYHMGESGGMPSLARYKEKFGAKAYPFHEYFIEKFPITRMRQFLERIARQLESRYRIKAESGYGHSQ